MRLDKLLSSGFGFGSRTDVKRMLKKGRVVVEGMEKLRPETKVDPENDKIYVDGELQEYKEFIYLMLNKPRDCISATYDKNYTVVTDYVPESMVHFDVAPVGRLDIDTEGLCLLTNDGKLAHKIISPKNHVPKVYYAELDIGITNADIIKFKSGVTIDDGYVCMPAELSQSDDSDQSVYVKIYEGKFHQVKRMFEAVGKNVVYLKRVRIKNLILDENLALGEVRELTEKELSDLKID